MRAINIIFLCSIFFLPLQCMYWKTLFPCFFSEHQGIDRGQPSKSDAAEKFKKCVKLRTFAAVLKMLQYDPDVCPVNVVIESEYPYRAYSLWTYVMEFYGLPDYHGDDCLSLEQWRELLRALVRHKEIDVNVCVKNFDVSECCYIYSPLCILLFGSGHGVLRIRNAWHERIRDALTLFKEEKVHFSPRQTTYTWGCDYRNEENSILYHLFEMYKKGHGGIFFGETVDLNFLDTVIEDLIELGVDTQFLCSVKYAGPELLLSTEKEVTQVDMVLKSGKEQRLQGVFEHACWKRDMKWNIVRFGCMYHVHQMQQLCGVKFIFQ